MVTAKKGMSLLVCLFVMSVTSLLLIGILGSETVRLSAVRNTNDSDGAKFLAGAAVHHVLAEMEHDNQWAQNVGTIPSTEFPVGSSSHYDASVAADPNTPGQYIVTGHGVIGDVTRTLTVTIKLGN